MQDLHGTGENRLQSERAHADFRCTGTQRKAVTPQEPRPDLTCGLWRVSWGGGGWLWLPVGARSLVAETQGNTNWHKLSRRSFSTKTWPCPLVLEHLRPNNQQDKNTQTHHPSADRMPEAILNSHIILNEISPTKKDKYRMTSVMCGIQKTDTKEFMYKTETDSQTSETSLRSPKGKGSREGYTRRWN